MTGATALQIWLGAGTLVSAAALSAALIELLSPLLRRYALARPNARSSHREPTPQGGGIAVIVSTVVVTAGYVGVLGGLDASSAREVLTALAAAILITVV